MPLFTEDVAALLDLEIWRLRNFIDYYSESTVAHDDHRGMESSTLHQWILIMHKCDYRRKIVCPSIITGAEIAFYVSS